MSSQGDTDSPSRRLAQLPSTDSEKPDRVSSLEEADSMHAAHARLVSARRGMPGEVGLFALPGEAVAPATDAGSVPLGDWAAVSARFRQLFDGLGEITEDGEGLYFRSLPPHVATAFSVRRDGRVAASMPLHDIDARVATLAWNAAGTEVALAGPAVTYTYRIPDELLRRR